MPLPDKLFSYEQSILSKMPILLECVEREDMNTKELFAKTKSNFDSISEFIETLEALFALKRIKINEAWEIEYVS